MAPLATRNTIADRRAGGALALAFVAPVLVPLAFGDAYDDSVQALWLLLPGTVALAGSKVLTSYIFSRGRPLVNTGITAVSLVVTVDRRPDPDPAVRRERGGDRVVAGVRRALRRGAVRVRRISGRSPLVALIPGREDLRLYGDAWHNLLGRISEREPERPGSMNDIEPVAPGERLRIAVLGDFDGVHTRSWLRWFIARGHDVHAISFYPVRAAPTA